MDEITVALADDHPVVRHGLKTLLDSEPDIKVVGEAGDGLQTIKMIEDLKPHVAVVDLMMAGLNGLEVARQMSRRVPATKIIVLSMHDNEAYVADTFRNGGSGYVLKDSSTTDLVRAVRDVVAGRRYLSPRLSERALEAFIEAAQSRADDPYEMLSMREREVLQLAAEGKTNSEIGARLSISPRTAEAHRAKLLRKLGIHSHADLIRYAIKRGLIAD